MYFEKAAQARPFGNMSHKSLFLQSTKKNRVLHPILHVVVLRIAFTCVHVFINNWVFC